MNKATWAMLNEGEQAMSRQAEGSSLALHDEDELVEHRAAYPVQDFVPVFVERGVRHKLRH
jgi:hypothetical protein